MKKISSALTPLNKKLMPALFACMIAFMLYMDFRSARANITNALVTLLIGGTALWFHKRAVWPLADEVYDCGDFLHVKRGVQEERIQLSDIASCTYELTFKTAVIRLKTPGLFGEKISFLPVANPALLSLAKNHVVRNLAERVARLQENKNV